MHPVIEANVSGCAGIAGVVAFLFCVVINKKNM
jgi:hypothetical protein